MLKGKGIIKFFLCIFVCALFAFSGTGVAQAYTVTYHGCNGNSWNSNDPTNAAQLPSDCSGFLGPCSFYDGWECFVDGGGYYIISFGQSLSSYLTGNMTCSLHAGSIPPTFRIRYHGGNCANPSNPTQDSPSVEESVQNGSVSYTIKSPENLSSQNLANLYSGLDNCVSFSGYYDYYGYNTTFPCSGSNCGSFVPADQAGGVSEGCIYNVDLYMTCDWTEYPVVYHGCDGTVDQNSAVIYNGSFNVLPYADTNLSSTGYTFQNWNTAADGSGTTYSANSTYTMNTCAVSGTTIDLYAMCTPDICTITLDPNNGMEDKEGGDSSSSTNNTKTIYSQYGNGAYKTNTNGVLSNQMTSQSGLGDTPPSLVLGIPIGRNVTYTFDAQTSAPIDPITGNQYSVTNPANIVKQRSFAGYYATTIPSNNTSTALWLSQHSTDQYIDEDGYITIYGQSASESIAQNNGSCPIWYAQYDCETSGAFPNATLSGYTVTKWIEGNNRITPGAGSLRMCTDHDYVARWQANTYTITYAPGLIGGNSVSKSVNFDANVYTDNTALAAITNPFTVPTGYVFTGWSSNYDVGTGTPTTNPMTSYDEGDSLGYYKVVGSTTMTAQWDCDTGYTWVNGECVKIYTVTYNANGHGTYTGGYTAETNVFGPGLPDGGQYGSTWTTKGLGASASHIEPATECDNFCGWSTNPSDTCGSQSVIASGTTVGTWNYTDDITLYAIWGCSPGCANNNGVCVPIVTHNVTYIQGNCVIPKGAYLEYNRPEGSYNLADAATANISPDGNASCCHFDGWSATDPSSNSSVTILNSPINLTSDMTLYGVCSCDTVNIVYYGCDGVSTFPDTTSTGSFSVLSYAATGMSETGYTFTNKWNTASDGNGDVYPVGGTFVVSSCDPSGTTINLYALCTPNDYTVTYHSGNCDVNNAQNIAGNTLSVTDSVLATSGGTYNVRHRSDSLLSGMFSGLPFGASANTKCLEFIGWDDPNTPNIPGNVNYFTNVAIDGIPQITVDYDCDNGSCTSISPYNYGSNLDLYAVCWWNKANATYKPGTCAGTDYVQYSVGIYGQSFNVLSYTDTGGSITVPSGYTFQGWSTSSSATSVDYSAGDSYLVGSLGNIECTKRGVMLYAVCSQDGYTITLNQQGADTSSNPTTLYTTVGVGAYLESSKTNLMSTSTNNITIPSKTAHTTTYNANAPQNTSVTAPGNSVATWSFNGFYESTADNSAQYIDDTGYITGGGDTTAKNLAADDIWYAKWTATCVDVQSAPTAPTGYSFGGWYKNAAGTGDAVAQICADDDFDTLYAKWNCATNYHWNSGNTACVIDEYTVTYVANAPTGVTVSDMPETNPVTVTVGANYTLASSPSATGYVSYGWECVNDTSGDIIEQTNSVSSVNYGNRITMPASNVTCTAQWAVNTIKLKWQPNGGTLGTTMPGTCTYFSSAGEPGGINGITPVPTRTGYTFNGWLVTKYECDLSGINVDINGDSWNAAIGGQDPTWRVTFSYGVIDGLSKCAGSTPDDVSNCSETFGRDCSICYCRATGYTPVDGERCDISSTDWVDYGGFSDNSRCVDSCASYCALYIRTNFNNLRTRVLTQSQ